MAEDLADYLRELGVKVQYLHSEVDTLERVQILRDLRLGVYDVLVGINLLREGIDLPEVTLVAILDADKEGFLRSAWSLIQMIGRAARNIGGEVVMYADHVTESMQAAIDETNRRRAVQTALQHRPRDRADDDRQGDPRHQRAAAGRRRDERGLRRRRAGRSLRPARPRRPERAPRSRRCGPDGGRHANAAQEPRVRAGRDAARRDPADPPARPRGGRLGRRRAGRRARRSRRPGARHGVGRLARDLDPAARPARGRQGRRADARGDHGRPSSRRRPRSPTIPWPSRRPRPRPTGSRASATSTTTTAAGRLAGSTGRPGTGRSPRTSSSGPAAARRAVAGSAQPPICAT